MVWFTPQDGPGSINLLQKHDMGYLHVVWASEREWQQHHLWMGYTVIKVPDG